MQRGCVKIATAQNSNKVDIITTLKYAPERGNHFGEPFDTYMQTNLNIEEANSAEVNFRKLAAGHIDYVITGYYAGLAYLAAQKQQENFVALKPFVTESNNYIAFVSSSPCIQYLDEFNRRLTEFVKSGEAPRLIDAALREWQLAPRFVH